MKKIQVLPEWIVDTLLMVVILLTIVMFAFYSGKPTIPELDSRGKAVLFSCVGSLGVALILAPFTKWRKNRKDSCR